MTEEDNKMSKSKSEKTSKKSSKKEKKVVKKGKAEKELDEVEEESQEAVSPIINTVLYTVVALDPSQLDNSIYNHLKNNLKRNVVGRCGKDGYVAAVHKIEMSEYGDMPAEDFSGQSYFRIKYDATLCNPQEGTNIICRIDQMNSALLKATSLSIICIVPPDQNNPAKFYVTQSGDLAYRKGDKEKGGKKLVKGDFIKVKILAKKFHVDSKEIKTIGFLEDMATDEEIEIYNTDMKLFVSEDKYIDPSQVNQELDDIGKRQKHKQTLNDEETVNVMTTKEEGGDAEEEDIIESNQ